MEMALKFIRDTYGENIIRISAQVYIKDFYKSLGFKEVSEIYLEDNIPHVEMIKGKWLFKTVFYVLNYK